MSSDSVYGQKLEASGPGSDCLMSSGPGLPASQPRAWDDGVEFERLLQASALGFGKINQEPWTSGIRPAAGSRKSQGLEIPDPKLTFFIKAHSIQQVPGPVL